nr:protein kinase [Nocardioidaceae bacterium]
MSDARLLAGRYRLESVLGRGGMGQVWLGRDETLGRAVAVKEIRLPTALSDDERDALCTRMLREARLTARLSHPGVVTVYDVVSEDGRPFIVMELLRVPTLADEVAANGPLAAGRVAAIGLELLTALDAAHREGIVHRDVKPSNVLLADKRVVLSDFGIATSESDPRMTATGLIVGSPTYMSPERLRGSPTGPETDMWSLGATLYAAAEGQPPFDAGTTMGTVLAVLNDPLTGPSVGGQLATVLDGLLDKDPGSRLDSQQAARLLRRVADRSGDDDAGASADAGDVWSWSTPAGAGTAVVRPPADERPIWRSAPGRPPAEPGVSASTRRPVTARTRRPGMRTLLLAVVVLVVLVLGVAAFVLFGSTDDPPQSRATPVSRSSEPSTTEPSATEPSATEPSATEQPDVPAGYRVQDDPLGFQVAVPRGWQRRLDGSTRVDYVAPDGGSYVRIDQQPEAGPSAEQAWLDAEPAVAARLPGYDRISIEPVDYRSWDTADWEFTWSGDSGTVHVIDRGIATDTRGFA